MIFAQSNMKEFLYTPGMFFEIPEFQRPYSWQEVNVSEFITDLEECIANGKNHYFGTVVQVKDTGKAYSRAIIDGQQRVTTSLLLIAAIYHTAKKNPSLIEDPATTVEKIEYQYLVNKDMDNNRVKLRTVTTDDEVLQHIFNANGEVSQLDDRDRKSNVYIVYTKFRDFLVGKQGLDKYINALEQFEIAVLTLVAGDDNPQRVFESINSTGKPLEPGDKIRNFALMLNSEAVRNRVYSEYWRPIERTLADAGKDPITDFFRHYLIAQRQALVKIPEVYPAFKALFDQAVGSSQEVEKIDTFYSDIKNALKYYELLKLVDTNTIKGHSDFSMYQDLAETIFRMRYIRVDIYIPYAISALKYHVEGKLSDTELVEVFKLIESYFSRRIIVNYYVTSVDRFMASLHRQVLDYLKLHPDSDYIEVLKYVLLAQTGQTQLPGKDDFETAIRVNPFYEQHGLAVKSYVLSAINDRTKESKATLHSIVDDGIKLTVEHVMPQTITRDWKGDSWREMLGADYERIHSEYLHTLANLTLTGYNAEYSNLPYSGGSTKNKMTLEAKDSTTGEMKKVGFMYSTLPINMWIASHEVWNETILKKRQEWWIDELQRVWPLPVTNFKPVAADTTVYLLKSTNLKGTGVRSVEILGEKLSVSSWAEALDVISESLYSSHPDFYEQVMHNEYLARYIKADDTAFNSNVEILETGYYVDTGNDTNTKLRIISAYGELFNMSTDDIRAELTTTSSVKEEL